MGLSTHLRPTAAQVAAAVADAHRREWAFVLAATVRVARDLDLAEECVQEAYAAALTAWAEGIPDRPAAWLTTTARRRAVDVVRRESLWRRTMPLLVVDAVEPDPSVALDDETAIPDDRLRLVFTCCHPALSREAQVALTLRLLCGLTTAEVARAFLVGEPTMAARITRAKKKIAAAGIPYRVPAAEDLPERLDVVLDVVLLLFTTGHTAPAGPQLMRPELVQRAVDLARMLHGLFPEDGDVAGLLALVLISAARSASRTDLAGRLVLLQDQDRSLWDGEQIREGLALVAAALRRRPRSRFALQAAIAAVHAQAPTWEVTDWREVVGLYDVLLATWPSPVVALNRAIAVGMADGPAAGLAALEPLAEVPQLAGYGYLAAARAEFLRRLGRVPEARVAYEEALLLTENASERDLLERRLGALEG